jgi:Fe-S-cluster-containing dehydrogenase component
VMEKCTYCVQRISKARIYAERDRRTIADGEVTTACQQACPTQAIYFGNLNDPDSAINRAKASPLNYSLLGELNVRPRTTYLAKVKNVNPALQEGDAV